MDNKDEKVSVIVKKVKFYSPIFLFYIIIILEIIAFIVWVPGSWNVRLTSVFAIITIYGLEIGLISRTDAFAEFKTELAPLVSPNTYAYFAGNLAFISFITGLVGSYFQFWSLIKAEKVAEKEEDTTPESSNPSIISLMVSLLFTTITSTIIVALIFAYLLFHSLVISTLAYIPIVIASNIVDRFIDSEVQLEWGKKKFLAWEILNQNPLAAKGFLIGIPSALLSLLFAAIGPILYS